MKKIYAVYSVSQGVITATYVHAQEAHAEARKLQEKGCTAWVMEMLWEYGQRYQPYKERCKP